MIEFLLGGITVADLVASMLFLVFHRRTRDRFFLWFAAAFLVDAAARAWTLQLDAFAEQGPMAYATRLFVYAFILAGILDKNLKRRVG